MQTNPAVEQTKGDFQNLKETWSSKDTSLVELW